ncbi:MAG: ferrous iron transport protein A [Clostridia bacterium]|nr:ferrous iron transport protein A [Clostridia bacterium]
MIPLTFAGIGEENIIKRIGGSDDVKHHLENLGFTVGGRVRVINTLSGNVIVSIKESRVAIGKDLAAKIFI